MYKILIITLLIVCSKSLGQSVDYKNYSQFLKKYVSESGNVSYDKIKKSELEDITDQFLSNPPAKSWSREDKLAYYINVYNAFTLKSIVDNYPVKSIKDIPNVWDKSYIKINKIVYSLGDIENKVFRKMDEPRIHFAINCASFSCPKLSNNFYNPDKIEAQLELATKDFFNDKSRNLFNSSESKISMIFNWYEADFKKNGSIIDFLNKFSNTKVDKKTKIKFLDYNWSLNK